MNHHYHRNSHNHLVINKEQDDGKYQHPNPKSLAEDFLKDKE